MRGLLVRVGLSTALIWGGTGVADAAPRPQPAVIGEATMLPDGSLSVKIKSDGPPQRGEGGAIVFKPDNPRYKEILAHVGDMKPGERKPIAPWNSRPPQ
jgi:hypothetical protein